MTTSPVSSTKYLLITATAIYAISSPQSWFCSQLDLSSHLRIFEVPTESLFADSSSRICRPRNHSKARVIIIRKVFEDRWTMIKGRPLVCASRDKRDLPSAIFRKSSGQLCSLNAQQQAASEWASQSEQLCNARDCSDY